MRKLALVVLAGLLGAGCSTPAERKNYVFDPVSGKRIVDLREPEIAAPATPPHSEEPAVPQPRTRGTALVNSAAVNSFYDTQSIAYSKEPGTRGYYQLAKWTDRPGQRFSEALGERLQKAGFFDQVADAASGVAGRYLISSEIAEFYHDASTPPGQVKVSVYCQVLDREDRRLLGRQRFGGLVPVAQNDAFHAVAGFNQATGLVLDGIVEWIGGIEFPPPR